ncbi:MAG: DUF1684 domain-containing protein [Chloroflexota bacterium]|nr:DUF1684 domain-containing protein [Chloroflexota bacterium]
MNDDRDDAGTLWLADWRRRVAELYVEVRALARVDPLVAWHHWVGVREELFRTHPQSPVPAGGRAAFRARHFPYDRALRFEVAVEPDTPAAATPGSVDGDATGLLIELPVSAGGSMSFSRIGSLDVPFPAGARRLALYWMAGYAGGLFLPFRDATNGAETYGAGRYLLDAAKSADLGGDAERGSLVLDFNFAFHPSCAFDPRWACPLAPPENRLDVALRAGERLT